jgi:predicted metal-dependent enzyme (double-stranded beta helix superfamily)
VLDIDDLVEDVRAASVEDTPVLAVREVLRRALERPDDLRAALPVTRAEFLPLHASDDVTILKVTWAPGMWVPPHDHLTWAAIGIYSGREDNTFYRRERRRIAPAGGQGVDTGDVLLLGDDVIHSVANPLGVCTGAIHVYGGNFLALERTDWDPDTLEEEGASADRSRWFDDWNERLGL